jgi:hypothetical protein
MYSAAQHSTGRSSIKGGTQILSRARIKECWAALSLSANLRRLYLIYQLIHSDDGPDLLIPLVYWRYLF